MSNSNHATRIGCNTGFLDLLALLFIALKLTHVIDWSWWLVLSPLLVQGAIVGIVLLIVVLCLIAAICDKALS